MLLLLTENERRKQLQLIDMIARLVVADWMIWSSDMHVQMCVRLLVHLTSSQAQSAANAADER